jgi:hypothetical protein
MSDKAAREKGKHAIGAIPPSPYNVIRQRTTRSVKETPLNTASADLLESASSKVKRHVLPLFLIMFIANYIDWVNVGFVNVYM